jgi:hypothetical protein
VAEEAEDPVGEDPVHRESPVGEDPDAEDPVGEDREWHWPAALPDECPLPERYNAVQVVAVAAVVAAAAAASLTLTLSLRLGIATHSLASSHLRNVLNF